MLKVVQRQVHFTKLQILQTKTIQLLKTSKTIYLPGLNGLRAIAAIAVVISHTTLALDDFGLDNTIFGTDNEGHAKGLSLAGNGVTIFFTLSGFLITYLLLKEKELRPLKVSDFYIRRLLRIWPLYYLYFAACLATTAVWGLAAERSSIPFYLLLAANIPFITGSALPFLAHYWSLGVEEQFYLFFPQLAKLSNAKLLKTALLLIAGLLSLKGIFWILKKRYGFDIPFQAITVTRFHIMLIGVCGAILYYNNNWKFMQLATHKLTQLACWCCILLITINRFHVASVIDGELIAAIAVFLIIGQITKKNNIINLENKLCDFTGKISYGMYVIHPLIIFYFAKIAGHFNPRNVTSYLFVYIVILAATISLAYISYEFYEKRFLKLKAKFTIIKSSATRVETTEASISKMPSIVLNN